MYFGYTNYILEGCNNFFVCFLLIKLANRKFYLRIVEDTPAAVGISRTKTLAAAWILTTGLHWHPWQLQRDRKIEENHLSTTSKRKFICKFIFYQHSFSWKCLTASIFPPSSICEKWPLGKIVTYHEIWPYQLKLALTGTDWHESWVTRFRRQNRGRSRSPSSAGYYGNRRGQ